MTVGTGNTGAGGSIALVSGQTSADNQDGGAITFTAGKSSGATGTRKGGNIQHTSGESISM